MSAASNAEMTGGSTQGVKGSIRRAGDASRHLFSDGTAFWCMTAVLLGSLSLGKGLRLPGTWAATQAQVDYQFGIVKRGLFGAALGGSLHINHYHRFALVSFAILFALAALLVAYTVSSGITARLSHLEVLALFSSGYGLTYAAHLVGYFDIALCAMAIALLLIRPPVWRLAAAIPVTIAAVMMHEAYLILFLPVVLLSFAAQGLVSGGRYNLARTLGLSLVVAVVGVSTTMALSRGRPLDPPRVAALKAAIQSKADFPIRQDFFEVMTWTLKDNLGIMKLLYFRAPQWQRQQVIAAIATGPTIGILLLVAYKVARSTAGLRAHVLAAMAIPAALSPLAMNGIGWDVARWYCWTEVTAFLVLLTLCRFSTGGRVTLSPGLRNLMILVLTLNVATGGMLFDGATINSYPFLSDRNNLLRWIHPSQWIPLHF